MEVYLDVVFRTVAVYLFIILAIRLFGKTELAQLSVFDLVFILLISNSVQNSMVGPNTSLVGGLIAASSLFVVNAIIKWITFRNKFISKFLQGEPLMLVHEGKILQNHLKKIGLTQDELFAAVREHGVANVKDVDLAILETDGNISILSQNYQYKTKRKRAHKEISK